MGTPWIEAAGLWWEVSDSHIFRKGNQILSPEQLSQNQKAAGQMKHLRNT